MLQVVSDEHVIDEGDDGDNFYVIDRSVLHTHRHNVVIHCHRPS